MDPRKHKNLVGDSNNATLFGESARADVTFCLMIAEGTQNLFHRAIPQSAPLGVRLMDRKPMLPHLSELVFKRLMSSEAPRTRKEMLSLQLNHIRLVRWLSDHL